MEQTTNFNLQKPGYADGADIEVINQNMDAIDAALKMQGDEIVTVSTEGTVHSDNLDIHVRQEDKQRWDGKAATADLTAHTRNAGIHVTAEDKTKWNAKASGNSAVWVATAVGNPDSNNSCRLTIPNFVFTEGCQVTFKAKAPPKSSTKYNCIDCGGVWYALRDLQGKVLEDDAWVVGANVTVTLTKQSFDQPEGWPTAFFKRAGSGGWPAGWKQEDVGEASENIAKNDVITLQTSGSWNTGISRIPDIGDSSKGYLSVSYSGDSNHMVLAKYGAIQFYKYSDQTYIVLAKSSTTPSTLSNPAVFAPSAPYIAFGASGDTSEVVFIYKRSGDTLIKLANLPALDNSKTVDIIWSPDSSKLFVAVDKTIYVINRNGDTFTKAQEITVSNWINNVCISPDGLIIVIACDDSSAIYSYKLINGEYVHNHNVASTGTYNGVCAFSSDNKHVVRYGRGTVSQGGYLNLFLRNSNDTFTKIETIGAPYTTRNMSISFDISGEYLHFGANEDKNKTVSLYRLQGEHLIILPAPTNSQLNSDTTRDSNFSRDGQFLAAIGSANPFYLVIWSTASKKYVAKIGFVKPSPLWWLPQGKLGIALETKLSGQQVKINLFPKINAL